MQHQNIDFESLIDYFAFFGGLNSIPSIHNSLFEYIEDSFVSDIQQFEHNINPPYILESPYRELLVAVAKGDGKIYSAFKRANISEALGEDLIEQLILLQIVELEASRESLIVPQASRHKSYRIQPKIRFVNPFYRFWFGFVEPFRARNQSGFDIYSLMEYLKAHFERLRTLIYEQLSNEMLVDYFASISKPILNSSSYWDNDNEFDIVALTIKQELVVAECKYKDRKVCKNELGKLKFKAEQSGLKPTYYALFSKDGFSKELSQNKEKNLFMFDINDMKKWIEN